MTAEELRVDPDFLIGVAGEFADHGQALFSLQQSCRRDADAVRDGWVGQSAGALTDLLDGWAVAADRQLRGIGAWSSGMQIAASAFIELDRLNAARLGPR
ncbi:WXG100 family type VII secretion target [Mycobacterium sp.]|uniref:WXG100 family type VII secretion target n=1 Tax=Mycobacterium sp. TaxID=1785 RepID=UPI003A8C83A9